jgi:membrane-bound lytic murein transglycosylase B
MGMPQFMPSSIVRWAIDFDGDGRIDLTRSTADVIGSVANYFRSYGWQPGMPTHYPVRFDPERLDLEALLAPDILPTFSVPSFLAKGAVLDGAAVQHQGPLALVELQNGDAAPSYVAGTENFYVITRYNWSSYYAMAVIELGQEVKRVIESQTAVVPAATATPAAPTVAPEPTAAAPQPLALPPEPAAPAPTAAPIESPAPTDTPATPATPPAPPAAS